jgi:predicted O-methyltransferase YrrM
VHCEEEARGEQKCEHRHHNPEQGERWHVLLAFVCGQRDTQQVASTILFTRNITIRKSDLFFAVFLSQSTTPIIIMGTNDKTKKASLAIIPSPHVQDSRKTVAVEKPKDEVADRLVQERISCHGSIHMGAYVERHLKEHPVLTKLRIHADSLGNLQAMQISADEGAVLQMIVRMLGAKRCLEVGFFTGYSALAVALALPQDGIITAIDINAEWAAVGEKFFTEANVRSKLDLRLQPGVQVLDELLINPSNHGLYDFGFIDADKSNFLQYYEKMLPLIRSGGVIAIDNIFWLDRVASEEYQDEETKTMRALNDLIAADDRIYLAYLPTADGVAICHKK